MNMAIAPEQKQLADQDTWAARAAGHGEGGASMVADVALSLLSFFFLLCCMRSIPLPPLVVTC